MEKYKIRNQEMFSFRMLLKNYNYQKSLDQETKVQLKSQFIGDLQRLIKSKDVEKTMGEILKNIQNQQSQKVKDWEIRILHKENTLNQKLRNYLLTSTEAQLNLHLRRTKSYQQNQAHQK